MKGRNSQRWGSGLWSRLAADLVGKGRVQSLATQPLGGTFQSGFWAFAWERYGAEWPGQEVFLWPRNL